MAMKRCKNVKNLMEYWWADGDSDKIFCVAAGESPLCTPSRVEVTEKKPVVLSDVSGSPNSSSESWVCTDTFYITDAKQNMQQAVV